MEKKNCDICRKQSLTIYFDGAMRRQFGGKWAFMCNSCHNEYGLGLGIGVGQKYEWNDEKQAYEQTAGGTQAPIKQAPTPQTRKPRTSSSSPKSTKEKVSYNLDGSISQPKSKKPFTSTKKNRPTIDSILGGRYCDCEDYPCCGHN